MLSGLNQDGVACPQMPKRKRVPEVPAFGRLLERLRTTRLGGQVAPERVRDLVWERYKLKTSGGSLRGYEKGWNKKFDPVLLSALAKIYSCDVEELIAVLQANRENPSLSDTEVDRILATVRRGRHGEAHVAARFSDIGHRFLELFTKLGDVAIDTQQLLDAYAHRESLGRQATKTRHRPPSGPDRD